MTTTDQFGNVYQPARTISPIKYLNDGEYQIIAVGTEFTALTHIKDVNSGKLTPFVSSPQNYRSCKGLPINLIWDSEFNFIQS